jgi:hypothetical protein
MVQRRNESVAMAGEGEAEGVEGIVGDGRAGLGMGISVPGAGGRDGWTGAGISGDKDQRGQ